MDSASGVNFIDEAGQTQLLPHLHPQPLVMKPGMTHFCTEDPTFLAAASKCVHFFFLADLMSLIRSSASPAPE